MHMNHIIVSIIGSLLGSGAAIAAESSLGGITKNGVTLTFEYDGELPPEKSYYIPQSPKGSNWVATGLRSTFSQIKGSTSAEKSETGQCAFLSLGERSVISCALRPHNELSGVVYESRGISKGGETSYLCVKGCSKRIPKRIQLVFIDPGC